MKRIETPGGRTLVRALPLGVVLTALAACQEEVGGPRIAALDAGPLAEPESPPVLQPELGAPSAWLLTREPGRAAPRSSSGGLASSPGSGGPPTVDDVPLGGTREPTIASNPLDPENLACASLLELRVSTNGGRTWKGAVPPVLEPGQFEAGDPGLAFDGEGRLFWCYLGRALDFDGNTLGIDVHVSECDPSTGELLPGATVDVTASAGIGRPAEQGFFHDKPWLFADASPASPFAGRLYLVWTEFLPTDTVVRFARSEDHGRTWRRGPTPSLASDGFVWPASGTVAPNGDVYVAYHERLDGTGATGQVYLLRSVDGGVSFLAGRARPFPPGRADVTFNVQELPGAIPGATFWLQGSAQAWVLAHPFQDGRLFVVACDDPDDDHASGDAANVYVVRSDDHGATWSSPRRVDSDTTSAFQVMPCATIDPDTAMIAVQWYDNRRGARNDAGNFLLDVYATISLDDGRTFCPEFRLDDLPFDPDPDAPLRFLGPPATTRIGEYDGIDARRGRASAAWCGNRIDAQRPAVSHQVVFDAFGLPLDVDLKPGGGSGVQVGSHGVLPVAVRGSGGFDVLSLDPLSATFGPGRATERHRKGHYGDVDGDGVLDLVLHFGTQEAALSPGDRDVLLEARTFGGVLGEGRDEVLSTASFEVTLEDFEEGALGYEITGPVDTFAASPAAAHDGVLGLRVGGADGWAFRDEPAVHVQAGDTLSVWLNLGASPDGRAAFGFGATPAGALSLVAAPDEGLLLLQANPGYGSGFLNARPQAWSADTWYRLEVVWGRDGGITGHLYDPDGTTLVNTVRGFDDSVVEGGLAFRATGTSDASFDTVEVRKAPSSRASQR